MATLLRGAPVAQALSEQIGRDCRTLQEHGILPTFCLVRMGERPEDLAYERGMCRRAEMLGVQVKKKILPADAAEEDLIQTLEEVNNDSLIHGCLLFRPLPAYLDSRRISHHLRQEKDIDAITSASMGSLLSDGAGGFAPCTATA